MIPKPLFVFEPNAQLCALVTRHAARQQIAVNTFSLGGVLCGSFVQLARRNTPNLRERVTRQESHSDVMSSPCSAILVNLDAYAAEGQQIAAFIRETETICGMAPVFIGGYSHNLHLDKAKASEMGIDRMFGTGLDPEWLDGFARDPSGFREREI